MSENPDVSRVTVALNAPGLRYRSFGNEAVRRVPPPPAEPANPPDISVPPAVEASPPAPSLLQQLGDPVAPAPSVTHATAPTAPAAMTPKEPPAGMPRLPQAIDPSTLQPVQPSAAWSASSGAATPWGGSLMPDAVPGVPLPPQHQRCDDSTRRNPFPPATLGSSPQDASEAPLHGGSAMPAGFPGGRTPPAAHPPLPAWQDTQARPFWEVPEQRGAPAAPGGNGRLSSPSGEPRYELLEELDRTMEHLHAGNSCNPGASARPSLSELLRGVARAAPPAQPDFGTPFTQRR